MKMYQLNNSNFLELISIVKDLISDLESEKKKK